ncbi:phosphocholine cytidylyltransferase family protein [Halomonas sp. IOP_31]|uniref:phosphocholine cytidylyltransferase family protein n=1 Tax=Halomonas sp. IOP_31 TaxID=2876584 RepID=UPI001E4015E7|nr:phosphocholine cytidylyltransferase family protein [Halomonas sp. IOP_31]MCD6008192.1 phosphocholine cytidylyltransferase family protein [Halomonas sp. IOP_31]
MQQSTPSRPLRAILLSAGQGKRLLPYTERHPKCLIRFGDKTVIEHQIDHLLAAGFERITVVLGYGIDQVTQCLRDRYAPELIDIVFNPFYEVADNLASCWMAREAMREDFLLLNGDTLFELPVLERLLEAPQHPVTLAIDRKARYDADDMKVSLHGDRLARVGKTLDPDTVNGESIGMMTFRGTGAALFRDTLERIMRDPAALKRWYLSVIDELAAGGDIFAQPIEGLRWAELDFPRDLEQARHLVTRWQARDAAATAARG